MPSANTSVSINDIKQWQNLKTFKHKTHVSSVAFSPDGRYLLSGGYKTMRLYDSRSGQFIREFTGHKDHVNSVAFSPDGRFVLSGSYDNTMRLWGVAVKGGFRGLLRGASQPLRSKW